MGIVREISPELDPVEFPDNMDEAAVDAFMAQRGGELRQGLIARRQAQLAAETEGEEELAYREGKVSPWEFWGSVARKVPQEGMRQVGQFLRGTGQYLASSPMPRERGEMGVVDLNRRLAQRTPQEIDRDVEGSMLRQLGTEIVADAPERFPTLPGVRDTLPSQVAGGVGSVAALLPAGLTGPAAPFVGGAMYGLSAGEDFADDAEQVINSRIAEAMAQGNTELAADLERRKFDMKNTARMAGRVIGAGTEGVLGLAGKIRVGKSQIGGIGARLAERMVPKSAPVAVQNAVRGAIEGGLTEAAQEGTEQILGNAAALAVYDPNRGIMDDVAQSVLVGGLTGKVVGGAFGSRGQERDPLPASRAAARAARPGEVVPGTEIPQDIGAPDLTLEDLGDLLPVEEVVGGVPQAQSEGLAQFDRSGTPVPGVQETPENMAVSTGTPVPEDPVVAEATVPEAAPAPAAEAPAVDSPTLSPATAAETPVAPAEGVTGEKPKRTRKPKRVAIDDLAGVEAAVAPAPVATVDPANDEQLGVNDRGEPVYWSDRAKTHYSIRDGRVQTAPWVEGLPDAAKQRLVDLYTNASGAAPTPAIAPDDTAMEAATAAAMAPAIPTLATTAPDEGIAERAAADAEMTRATAGTPTVAPAQMTAPEEGVAGRPEPTIPPLPTELAEAIAADEAPDVFVENAVRKFGESERASAQSTKPNERQRQVLEQGKRIAAEKGWDWNKVKETARRQLGLNENFLKPESRADQVFQMMRKEDADAAKRRQRTAEEMARIDAETKARRDKEAADKAEKEAAQRRQAEEKAAADEKEKAAAIKEREAKVDRLVSAFSPKFIESYRNAKTKKAKAKLASDGLTEAASRVLTSGDITTEEFQAGLERAAAPVEGAPLTETQRRYEAAKAKLDALGPEPRKPSSERQRFGTQGRAKAAPEAVARYDAEVKAYKNWTAKYSKLKKAEVEASNAVYREDPGYFDRKRAAAAATPEPTITEAPAAEPPAAQAAEVATPEVVKQSKPPMAPKAQKAYLLEKIDEAIATAPEGVAEKAPTRVTQADQAIANAETLRRNKSEFGTVTIEVPGDGTFEVLNTKASLSEFKERAKKFPVSSAKRRDDSESAEDPSKPLRVGKNTKESFLAAADDFVFKDKDPGARGAIQNILSNGFRSVALDGKMMLVWDGALGGSPKDEAFFNTSGKEVERKPEWRIPDWQSYIPKDSSVVLSKLDTERLFGVVQQAIGVQPRRTIDAKTKKPMSHDPFVDIVKNPDGSIGVYAVGADQGEYTHNTQKGGKVISTVNADMLLKIIQASRRMGSKTIDIEKVVEKDKLEPLVIKWDGATAILMPIRREGVPEGLKPILAGKPQPDILERALNAAIKATDRTSATFSDPFLIAAVGLPVLNAALRIVRRVYLKTRDLARAKRQGMRLIRRQLRSDKQADLPRIEEAFSQLVEGTAEKPGPDQIEAFQAADGSRRQKSRGLFTGDVTVDTDAQWQAGAERWINQFNGNIRRAFEAARSTDYATTGLNPAAQDYVFGRLLELTEIQANAARNDVDAMRALNLQKEIADAMRLASSEAGKALGARALVQNRLLWMFPVLNYRNLIREAQKRLPFPDVVADEVRTWLQESGRRAVQEMRNAMTDADKVFARELKGTVRDMRVVWRDVMTASVESQEAIRKKILEELVKAPELKGLSRQGYIDIANLLGKAWERERARIFAAEFRKQVPLPSVKEDVRRKLFTAIPDILKWANLGLLDNEAFRNAVAPKFGVAKFDGETAKKLNEMAQRAQKVGGSNRKRIIRQMYNLMQIEGGVRWQDLVRDYWYAAVLTALDTQVDNVMGIIAGQMLTAMGMAMAKSEVRGIMGKAYTDGFYEGIKDFWPILTNGEVERSINFNVNQPNNTLEAIGASKNRFARMLQIGKYTSRFMEAINHINALSVNQAMAAWALSNRYPIEHVTRYMLPSENVRQNAIAKAQAENTPPDLMNKRVREIIQESIPVEVLLSAKEISDIAGFTNKPYGLLGIVYEMLNKAAEKLPGLKLVTGTNFARFAFNAFNQSLNLVVPVALYRYYHSQPGRQDAPRGLKFGEEHRKLILAQAAFGTALATFAAAFFLGDDDDEKDRFIDINGSFKSLPDSKRKQLLSEGRLPYSIRIGDTYVSYRQLPFGAVLSAIGELRDRQLFAKDEWDNESIIRKFGDGMAAGILTIKDAPAISSFTEFLGVANAYKFDPNEQIEKSWPRYLARLSGSFIPRALKQADAWADPSIYKANTGHEFFLQQLPYGRRTLGEGPVLNVLGEPVQVERYPWSRWIRTRKEDKAWSTLGELASKGVFMPVPVATVTVLENGKRREMTPAESYRYQRRVGQAYRKFVEDNSERLLRMKPEDANEFIKNRTEQIRERMRNVKGA